MSAMQRNTLLILTLNQSNLQSLSWKHEFSKNYTDKSAQERLFPTMKPFLSKKMFAVKMGGGSGVGV